MNKYFTATDSKNPYKIEIDFVVQDDSWQKDLDDLTDLSLRISKQIFNQLGLSKYVSSIEFSVTLTDNQSIQKINLQYLSKDKPTNVLSFPIQEISENNFDKLEVHDGFVALGDIIFAYGILKDESLRDGKIFHDHFAHLLVHGVLHLLGYDHEHPLEATRMEKLEVDILSKFNINSPYEILT
jgi:probable rRNA maturation factor